MLHTRSKEDFLLIQSLLLIPHLHPRLVIVVILDFLALLQIRAHGLYRSLGLLTHLPQHSVHLDLLKRQAVLGLEYAPGQLQAVPNGH